MIKHLLLPAAALLAGCLAGPALAQQNDKALVVYGNDKCPEGTICIHAPESDRYRIPQSLRSGPLAPQDQPWAQRAASISDVGASGTGSCSTSGAGGWTGCWKQQMKAARAEKKQDANAEAESPLPK
ncbi:MAG: hypothetical protein JF628_09605 [Sphingomonas sp.]|nr:hypothetical protein [Sphingomonas sp.]